MNKTDLLIQEVSVFNSVFRQFYLADVYILNEKIYYIDPKMEHLLSAVETVDGRGLYMAPGLVDIHMHIESSMMTPAAMAKRLAQCGVTTIVSEPHEMANVNGLAGVLDMIHAGEQTDIDIYYGIPSCVPSTSTALETTGGIIDFEAMKQLLSHPQVACVGEVMNYRQIIRENGLEITKLLHYLAASNPRYVIEGHCPALQDLDLAKFVFLGIDSDHTEHSLAELQQRFFNGMFIELQEKMLRKEVLDFIDEHQLDGHFGFVTDDVMADTLMEHGHLDCVVRKAIAMGMSPERAIYHATYTNAQRMKFTDRTMLTPGKLADFVLLRDVNTFQIEATYKNGRCIYQKDRAVTSEAKVYCFPSSYRHSIQLAPVTADTFALTAPSATAEAVTARVCIISDGSTKTTSKQVVLPVKNGEVLWENGPYLLAAVFERYGKNGNIGFGFVTGDALKHGAVATTYAHDHHNLLVVGSNKKDLVLAVNTVIAMNGGMTVTDQAAVTASLPLPIGGILSDASAASIGTALKGVRMALQTQGYQHYNPIMSLCTLSLLASPALKLSDQGLVDVAASAVVPLFC